MLNLLLILQLWSFVAKVVHGALVFTITYPPDQTVTKACLTFMAPEDAVVRCWTPTSKVADMQLFDKELEGSPFYVTIYTNKGTFTAWPTHSTDDERKSPDGLGSKE